MLMDKLHNESGVSPMVDFKRLFLEEKKMAAEPFHFLEGQVRRSMEKALEDGERLELLWVKVSGFSLFMKLFGRELGAQVSAKMQAILFDMIEDLAGGRRLLTMEEAGPASFVLIFNRRGAADESLADLTFKFRLRARSLLGREVVKLTGQSLGVSVGCSHVSPRPDADLEHQVHTALYDARDIADSDLDLKGLTTMSKFNGLVNSKQLISVYQPIIDLRKGKTMGWEALARGPKQSYFNSPLTMFEFAEEVGRLFELESSCRKRALEGLGELEPGQRLFLNIHPQTMGDPKFRSGETRQLLEKYGLEPRKVVFEITERHSVKDFNLFHRTLDHYRSQGYQVAIDDVGTGYSGLTRIAKIRPEFIKIDMSIIRGVESNPVHRAIIEALVTLADKIGSSVIAEGIESALELSTLVSMGVHFGQGYYLGRPVRPKAAPKVSIPVRAAVVKDEQADWKCSMPVSELAEVAPTVDPSVIVRDVKAILDRQPISGVVVAKEGRPAGLVMSHALDRQLGTHFGTALYYERAVSDVMDLAPMMVEGSTPVELVAAEAMRRNHFKIYDHVVVTEKGMLSGIVSVQKILDALARVQVEMAKGASPLTGLPGRVGLDKEVENRWENGKRFCFIYVDLDNFKAYNDSYGFDAGDKMIRLTADILVWAARRHGENEAYVGHVGGDDFVVISGQNNSDRLCRAVVRCFSRLVKTLYHEKDRKRGYIISKGRDGKQGKFPLVAISLGIVECSGRCDFSQVSLRAAEVKSYAKSKPGNVYVRDRRSPLGVCEAAA